MGQGPGALSERQGYGEQFDVEGLNFFRRLLAAVQNREFVVYFQPKVSISDMRIAGAEALVRWNCNGQILPPVKFIPFCERTGLVIDIDFYVLEETCRKMRQWMDDGLELVRISVNFSKYHFNETGVAERIFEVIQRYGVPTEYLEVEFTETAYLDKEELLESTVDKLRSYGIKSSIDDFGSGYSSLNLLQNMDFEVVKLDRSLLGKGVENHKAKKVISSIIHMAKELEMEVLAEGVETDEELKLLQELKCDIVQGFLFDKPLPVYEFEKRLRARSYSLDRPKPMIRENRVKLNDVGIEEIELAAGKGKNSASVYEGDDVRAERRRQNKYIDIEPTYGGEKKHTGVLIAGILLMLLALTVIGVTVLLAGTGRLGGKTDTDTVAETTYTKSEVDAMIAQEVKKAETETRAEVDEEYREKIHEAAEVAGGMANYLRSVFPDEMVFVDGYKFKFIPINRELKLSTVEAAKFVTDEETGFMYYTDDYGERTSYIGIDVSSFQRDVDWNKVAQSGIDFAIIRCGLRGYGSEGNMVSDLYFEKNIKGALAAGLNVGVYFYTQSLNTAEAVEEANFALELIKPYNITGPVVLDVESANSEERIKNITASERTDCIIAFCDTVKAAGYTPMIYSDVKYFTMKMEIDRLENYKKWYANYNGLSIGEEMSIWGYNNPFMFPYEFDMWQYSNSGSIEGISGGVDFDVLFEKWW